MAITINGTTGIAGVDGSASTPAVQGTDTNTGIFYPAADTIAFAEGGVEVARINSDAQFVASAGTASLPVYTTTGDTNTGIFFPAADTIAFSEGGSEAMRINSSGNVGIGVTSIVGKVQINTSDTSTTVLNNAALYLSNSGTATTNQRVDLGLRWQDGTYNGSSAVSAIRESGTSRAASIAFLPANSSGDATEKARITSDGAFLIGATSVPGSSNALTGTAIYGAGSIEVARDGSLLVINRKTTDGTLVFFRQDGTDEGNISVSGTTVSYNGGHLSRWAQMLTNPDLLKGTVMSNLDEMNEYVDAEGKPVENEQLNKVKVSDVEGDVNVAGVFVNWDYDDAHQVDEINMAMTGDMIIRIAQGVVVQKGDLLMSAGDGTAKPQDDDIVRSKTVAKVTSNHVTCTYADGSYCVPCVLMAC